MLETKMLAGSSGYDVVVPSGTFLQRQIAAGAFQKLDMSKLPNAENLWDVVSKQTAQYDPDNAYSINYMWGTTGIGVNVGKVKEVLGDDAPIDSIALLLDPKNMEKLASCGVHILDAPSEVIPAVLNYIGEDPDSHDPDVIAKAEPVLQAVRPHITKFHSSEYINALANGDICVAFDAKNMAAASNYVYYANGNLASQEFLVEDVIGDPAIYPDEKALETLFTTTPYPAKVQRTVTRLWTKIKSGV